jgi:ABC-type dipeptide/oligopeptide/nickel transport system ATPase subunit
VTPLLVRKGAVTYLKAPSGVGKTTVVKLMMGLLRAEKMTMRLGQSEFTENTSRSVWARTVWGRRMTMVFQHADEALNQNAKVRDVFAGLPLATKLDQKDVLDVLSELFDEKPDPSFLLKPVQQLSGGQKQRLNLLRSMFLNTDILILDEPLNGLDFASAVKVLARLEQKIRAGKGVLLISHNEEIFDTVVRPEDTYYLHASA